MSTHSDDVHSRSADSKSKHSASVVIITLSGLPHSRERGRRNKPSRLVDELISRPIQTEATNEETYKTDDVMELIKATNEVLKKDTTLIEINNIEDASVYVFGDIYGHFDGLCTLLRIAGFEPSAKRIFVFLGECVR